MVLRSGLGSPAPCQLLPKLGWISETFAFIPKQRKRRGAGEAGGDPSGLCAPAAAARCALSPAALSALQRIISASAARCGVSRAGLGAAAAPPCCCPAPAQPSLWGPGEGLRSGLHAARSSNTARADPGPLQGQVGAGGEGMGANRAGLSLRWAAMGGGAEGELGAPSLCCKCCSCRG